MKQRPDVGRLPSGPRGTIADVAGVTVGHATIAAGDLQTGVTVVRPHAGDPFLAQGAGGRGRHQRLRQERGLMQLNELGVLETPIALTTTLSVGTVAMAQVRAAIAAHPGLARTTTTVNPLVFECNDGYLNDVQALAVTEAHYDEALAAADGRVRARRRRGGPRHVVLRAEGRHRHRVPHRRAPGRQPLTLGALVLANFGRLETLTHRRAAARPAARERLAARSAGVAPQRDQGSIIVVLATDAPLDHRQLRRVAMRAAAGHRAHRLVLRPRQRRHRARVHHRRHRTARHARPRARRRVLAEAHLEASVRGRGRGDRAGDRRRAVRGRDGHRLRRAHALRAHGPRSGLGRDS